MSISNELDEVVAENNLRSKDVIIWLSMLDVLMLITIFFTANFSTIIWFVNGFLLVCLFIQTIIICISLRKNR